MDAREINIQEGFTSMCAFNDANAADYAEFEDAAAAFATIRASKEAIDAFAATQTSGARGRAVTKKAAIGAAMLRKMKSIAKSARSLDIEDEGFRRLFSVTSERAELKRLAAAREFLTQANIHKADLMRRGQRQNFIEKLTKDVNDYELAISEKAGAQGATVGATAGIDAEIEDGMEAREIADAILQVVYEDNPVKLAEWTRARHIKRLPKSEETEPEQPQS